MREWLLVEIGISSVSVKTTLTCKLFFLRKLRENVEKPS